ncbi:MAG: FISUMP domain-containing protein [Bacteroidales bacterium]|nr:FISUMP domain-containing protein [Bacteroidales bacterium]
MKKRLITIIFAVFTAALIFQTNGVFAQGLCHGDTITINVTGYSGSLQWEVSDDLITWTDIPGAIGDTIKPLVRSHKHYRVRVKRGTCDFVYSDTISVSAVGCPCPGLPTITDADGHSYPTVRIGAQCWMAENLNSGTAMPNNQTLSTSTRQKYCYGASNTNVDPFNNCPVHGGLYTWAAAMQGATTSNTVPSGVQGVCPQGWHLPSDEEWKILEAEIELPNPDLIGWRGQTQGTQLKPGGTANFDGLMSGKREYTNEYQDIDTYGYFWTTTQSSTTSAWLRSLWNTSNGVGRFANNKNNAVSVRCVKD